MVTGNFLDEAKAGEAFANLLQVNYFPSFSLGLFYPTPHTSLHLDWKWKYFPDSPLVRFVAVDALKRGDPAAATALCVQSQRCWAREHLELSKAEAGPLLLAELRRLLPELPEPAELVSHKWRFSQIRIPYPGGYLLTLVTLTLKRNFSATPVGPLGEWQKSCPVSLSPAILNCHTV